MGYTFETPAFLLRQCLFMWLQVECTSVFRVTHFWAEIRVGIQYTRVRKFEVILRKFAVIHTRAETRHGHCHVLTSETESERRPPHRLCSAIVTIHNLV